MKTLLGANWRTTLTGALLAAMQAYQDGAFGNPADWRKWLVPVGIAVLGYLAKDRNVTGGSVANDPPADHAPPGTPLPASPTTPDTDTADAMKSRTVTRLGFLLLCLVFLALLLLPMAGCSAPTAATSKNRVTYGK